MRSMPATSASTALQPASPPPLEALPASWQVLQHLPLLAHMEMDALRALAAQFQWRLLEPGQTLPDALCSGALHLLVTGRLWVRYFGSQGRELVVGDLLPGQWCGLHTPGHQPSLHLVAEAAESSLIASLDAAVVQELVTREPAMLRAMLEGANRLIWSLVARVVDMGTLSVRGRLHARLLTLAERAGVQHNQALLLPAPTQASLAALLGSSREEVAREMSRLVRLGLLRREGRGLLLTNVDGLRVLLEDMR
jgi:CRP-like cAMP-binding protein